MREIMDVLNGASTVAMSALLNSLWLALAAALLAWAILRFTLPIGAAARHLVWWVVLGIALALAAGQWLLERRSVTPAEQTVATLAAIPNNVGRPPWAAAGPPAGLRPFQELG